MNGEGVGPPRWVWVSFIVVSLLVLAGTGVFLIDRQQQNSTLLARQDCARAIAAEQTETKDAATTASRAVSRFYYQETLIAVRERTVPTEESINQFASLVRQAENTDTLVNKLPNLAAEVDRRCPG